MSNEAKDLRDLARQLEEVCRVHRANSMASESVRALAEYLCLRARLMEVGFDFLTHLHRQIQWSEKTFGPGPRTKGVIDHIRKELNEIEAKPDDLAEWIDVVILGIDGAWRSGATPQQIIDALVRKQLVNEERKWPDWRTMSPDVAIEHNRS